VKELTQRQREVIKFISDYIIDNNFPPTIREVANYFGISIKGAYDHVAALRKKGSLKFNDRQARTMEVVSLDRTKANKDLITVPFFTEKSPAGRNLAEENTENLITLHASMLKKSKDYFAYKVQGDSMNGAGILEGDLAIIEKDRSIENGEIGAFVLENGVSLRRFYREGEGIRLCSENPNYEVVHCNNDLKILGRLVTLIRSY
jgi:repressor LexA